MANELKGVLDQLKTDVAALTNVSRAQLGQILDALPEATHGKAVASVYMVRGHPLNEAFGSTSEKHLVEMRFYWLLIPEMVETIEQNIATMWDVIMTKFFGSDADRNLTETCTIALVGGEGGAEMYRTGYEEVSGKMHRILIVPIEITLDTHSV